MNKEQILLVIVFALLMSLMLGCATAKVWGPDGKLLYEVQGGGFLRDIDFMEKKPDGTIIHLKTKSSTKDVMLGVNELIGTATATVEKLNPVGK